MEITSRLKPVLLTLLCVLLLVARLDGAHWHLCFDGKEPAVSLHLADLESHHDDQAGMNATHHDADVMMGSDLLPKSSKAGFQIDSAPVLLAAAFLLALLYRRQIHPLTDSVWPVISKSLFLLPPLRGPPR